MSITFIPLLFIVGIVFVGIVFIIPSIIIACKFGPKELIPFWKGFLIENDIDED